MYWFAWKKRKNSDLFLYIVIMLQPTWLQDFVRLYAAHELKWVYTWLIMIFKISKVHSQEAEWLYLDNKHFFVQILFLLLLSHNHVQTLSQPERSPWGFCELQSTHPDDDVNRYPILLQTQAKIYFFSFNSSYRLNNICFHARFSLYFHLTKPPSLIKAAPRYVPTKDMSLWFWNTCKQALPPSVMVEAAM